MQIAATLNTQSLYPFSAYRMFSKNWKSGIVMTQIQFEDSSGKKYRPWDLLKIPFFQANNISFGTFLDPSPEAQKLSLCSLLRTHISENSRILRVFEEEWEYSREGSQMASRLQSQKLSYECNYSFNKELF